MKPAIVAGRKNLERPRKTRIELPQKRSVERICNGDAEIFLAGVEIFRPDSPAPGTLGSCDNHAVVEFSSKLAARCLLSSLEQRFPYRRDSVCKRCVGS